MVFEEGFCCFDFVITLWKERPSNDRLLNLPDNFLYPTKKLVKNEPERSSYNAASATRAIGLETTEELPAPVDGEKGSKILLRFFSMVLLARGIIITTSE